MTKFMGIDIGTSSVKVVVIDYKGNIVAQSSVNYPLLMPSKGFAEQNPETWWNATKEAIRRALSSRRIDPEEVEAVGLSGQMHGTVIVDKMLRPLRNAIIWADSRSHDQSKKMQEILGDDLIRDVLCNPIMPGFMAPTLLWIREHEPLVFEKIYKIMLPKDYIRLKLTETIATDVSDASATLLFDVKRRCWSKKVLSEIGLEENLLPEVYESIETVGEISSKAARETGLPKGINVIAGGGDSPVSAIGCGLIEEGVISVNIGSAGQVFTAINNVKVDPKLRIHTFCHAVPNKWYLQGAILSAGIVLDWFIKNMGLEDLLIKQGISPHSKLIEEAEKVPAGSAGLIFLPYLFGERSPHMDPYARGVLLGLNFLHARGHLIRAMMEGVAFALRDSYEVFRELGIIANEILIRGGGGKSTLWRQIISDVFGCRILATEVEEAAFGAAILAAVGVGAYSSVEEAVKSIVKLYPLEEPSSDSVIYEKLYNSVYKKLYPTIKEFFKILRDF